ncbi:uncharacterized protein LOC132792966 [Drosophila nasuta]|uniref:uncharacterized protein LOC132792966 n=1 Tax=Drosophila nasuta TaxID=42062 RepID=UPI00295F2032|nr:uncharacterized protein LOC132792966 [Drosophila nasuta]
MRNSESPLLLQLLLLLLALESTWSATILHHDVAGASAISHQSFIRLSSPPAAAVIHQLPATLATPTVRIINVARQTKTEPQLQLQLSPQSEENTPLHTPAHLTYAAHPVVHQMLPRIKPVRSISYASLLPGPRQGHGTHTFAQSV